MSEMYDNVMHPPHYGGGDDPYEAIKVITAWGLNFDLGSVLKYVKRAGRKFRASEIEDLKKAQFYLDHHIKQVEARDGATKKD